ncbi:MAG: DUF58 domain-containing protein, partial [Verrucomicrobiota bacterium]
DFEDFREYQPGDEVRTIDWNVTARLGTPFVKKFVEERELTVYICVDLSASGNYGSENLSKREVMAEVAALLAFSALQNKDKVALILFTDEVELYLPPKKETAHALRIVREILFREPQGKKSTLNTATHILKNAVRKRSLVFMLSDFQLDGAIDKDLKTISRQHDFVAVQVSDPAERKLPNAGRVCLSDPETGEQVIVNTNSAKVRKVYSVAVKAWQEQLEQQLRKLAIDHIHLSSSEDYLPALHHFFKARAGAR